MDNHFHLVVETPDANLSKAMRQLNGVYTQAFNRRHGRVGNVLQGRFKAILVDQDRYLLELCRNVAPNPVRSRTIRKPDTYSWSSYQATVGLVPASAFLTRAWLLSQFSRQYAAAQRKYRLYRRGDRHGPPWEHVQGQVLLGSERFIERLTSDPGGKRPFKEIPRQQRFASRPPLRRLFPATSRANRTRRKGAIRRAYLEHGYSLSEIGRVVGLHYSAISSLVNPEASDNAQSKA